MQLVPVECPRGRGSFLRHLILCQSMCESDSPSSPLPSSPSQLLPPGEQLEHAHGPNLFRANSYDPKRFNLKDRDPDEYDDQASNIDVGTNAEWRRIKGVCREGTHNFPVIF